MNKLFYSRHYCRSRHIYGIFLLLTALGLFTVILNVYELRLMLADHEFGHISRRDLDQNVSHFVADVLRSPLTNPRPIVWFYIADYKAENFRNIFNMFDLIGYERGDSASKWDVLWSHDFPFYRLNEHLGDLKPHQKVNHFPGSGHITKKVSLASSDIKVIPRAFVLPIEKDAFLNFAKDHSDKLWVQKSNLHRGIRVLTVPELDLNSSDTFIQEYVDNPFLIDGRRFDIGLYVTITSINPLRAYIYQGEWLVRFCARDYYPFNASDVNKYVIADDYAQLWELPSLRPLYTELSFSRKASLLAHLVSRGKDVQKLSQDLEAAVRQVLYAKEPGFIAAQRDYPTRNYFEMVRFDFLVDNELNVYLMEVNMSPNLSSVHFAVNKPLYEQVIFSMLCLVGIASQIKLLPAAISGDSSAVLVSPRDVRVSPDICISCNSNCHMEYCQLCSQCITSDFESVLSAAYSEHINRKAWRRAIPQSFPSQFLAWQWKAAEDERFIKLSTANRKMALWYHGKCLQDADWCL